MHTILGSSHRWYTYSHCWHEHYFATHNVLFKTFFFYKSLWASSKCLRSVKHWNVSCVSYLVIFVDETVDCPKSCFWCLLVEFSTVGYLHYCCTLTLSLQVMAHCQHLHYQDAVNLEPALKRRIHIRNSLANAFECFRKKLTVAILWFRE